MFMRTGLGHYSVEALTTRPDLSAKWEMTAANTLSLCQVMVIPFMTRDTPQDISVKRADPSRQPQSNKTAR